MELVPSREIPEKGVILVKPRQLTVGCWFFLGSAVRISSNWQGDFLPFLDQGICSSSLFSRLGFVVPRARKAFRCSFLPTLVATSSRKNLYLRFAVAI